MFCEVTLKRVFFYCVSCHKAVRVHIFYKVFPKQSYLVTGFLWFVTETKIWYVRDGWWSKEIKRTITASKSVFASAISWKFKKTKPPNIIEKKIILYLTNLKMHIVILNSCNSSLYFIQKKNYKNIFDHKWIVLCICPIQKYN